jgi:hypothetical protein
VLDVCTARCDTKKMFCVHTVYLCVPLCVCVCVCVCFNDAAIFLDYIASIIDGWMNE